MSDLAARRREIFGAAPAEPPPDATAAMLVLIGRINELTSANASLTDSLAAANAALQVSAVRCSAECQRADGLQAQLTQEEAECAVLIQALAAQKQPVEIPEAKPVDIGAITTAIATAFTAAMPAPVAAVAPPIPKSWLLNTTDANGNARKVRMTPEY